MHQSIEQCKIQRLPSGMYENDLTFDIEICAEKN